MLQQADKAKNISYFDDNTSSISNLFKRNHDNKNFMRNYALVVCREYLGGIWKMLQTSQIIVEPMV
jgi:hypothetical protein